MTGTAETAAERRAPRERERTAATNGRSDDRNRASLLLFPHPLVRLTNAS